MSNQIHLSMPINAHTTRSHVAIIDAIKETVKTFVIGAHRAALNNKELADFDNLPNDAYRIMSIGGVSATQLHGVGGDTLTSFRLKFKEPSRDVDRGMTIMFIQCGAAVSVYVSIHDDERGFGKGVINAIATTHYGTISLDRSDDVEYREPSRCDYLVTLQESDEAAHVELTELERASFEEILQKIGKPISAAFSHTRETLNKEGDEVFKAFFFFNEEPKVDLYLVQKSH
ncbi:hypothetical protein [Photobacterium kishitanii]|uniref:Uncharacterized protein n=1 Tax=Photobacterium kishitanii TaxID=318456 RepID=A0A2T3KL62_9GAMM|nr:hypothetical protein [Photobacterium kishitanii]PSV00458.1 hypothetical protein C9J27_04820 [Photobacterium kishitanii]